MSVPQGHGEALWRALTNVSVKSQYEEERAVHDVDPPEQHPIRKADDWKLIPEVKEIEEAKQKKGIKHKKLGVTWNNLTVKGVGADHSFQENVFSQFNIPRIINEARRGAPTTTILDNSQGCVKPGEMLLVLGRPGSGCTTLLKMLSNRRDGYADIQGDIWFGSLDHTQAEQYRGKIMMNTEEELFFPTLTVGQTIDFATKLNVPALRPDSHEKPKQYQQRFKQFLLESMGISHAADTKVGNEFVRGVSGGERKRVSIIECLAGKGSVMCWDNSTRGLDASTALEYARAMRALTDVLGTTTIITLYQAGNGIYNLFDKVLILDEGKQIFYGPRENARPFMEALGFICDDSANVADFLTGVTVPTERQIQPGWEDRFPRTADEIRQQYTRSEIKRAMDEEVDYAQSDTAKANTEEFIAAVQQEKKKGFYQKLPFVAPLLTQIQACTIRQFQIVWSDKATFIIKQASTLAQALISGSLFYNAPNTSSGLFLKGGALFFALLYNSLLAMSEVTSSFSGRPVLAKHKSFAFHHPAAFCFAQICADIPVLLFQISIFSIVLYWMVGLTASASAFFTFWFVVFTTTFCMIALFRSVGASFRTFDAASKISGFLISALVIYTGYMIHKPQMHPWLMWIYWIDPLAYGFQSLLGNEFHDKVIPCVGPNLVPSGPGYSPSDNSACTGVGGAPPGASRVTGDEYLASLSYSHAHVWRNIGIVWAWWALFVALTVVFTSRWKLASKKSGFLLIPREKMRYVHDTASSTDEEAPMVEKRRRQTENIRRTSPAASSGDDAGNPNTTTGTSVTRNTSVFTWKDLVYSVKTPSGERVLLDHVQGWVKPGMLGALMGSSGAGKTTLLDVLAQRKTEGTIHGSILVDGRPLSLSFQRSTGYCEQLDVHEPLATVREALEFSALLRQGRDVPKDEKLAYVDTIIDLLEMHDIENTLIGSTGAGLSIEQRKRLTIGVELVSKPSILMFLDEPTSGLDGQAAFNIVRFLKKLASFGQAVLVTIHQPSASLFKQFDSLLLLSKGGKTVYFGDIGEDATTLKDYFRRNGAPCPADVNPAEHMIDVVSGSHGNADWHQIWLESPEFQSTCAEINRINEEAASKEPGSKDDGFEFAMPLWDQIKLVLHRMNISLYRNTDYANNKFMLHIILALFNGFSFWMIGDRLSDLQLRLFTVFNFIFVAPGVINQLQPLFIQRRNIFEAREKKAKMYSWVSFVTALILSEVPYLCVCAVLYFACWYYTVGFPRNSNKSGATFFVMLMYEFVYTGIGQFIAAYAPNEIFASLVNPLVIGILVSFCGVLVPYAQLQVFWRYWIYYLNPFNYLVGSILTFTVFDAPVQCAEDEMAIFDPPGSRQTCGEYLRDYLAGLGSRSNLTNPDATSGCRVCQYRRGSDYLYTVNLKDYYYGWRDAAIVVIFALSGYSLVYALMKLRTKASKTAD
ncbi:hypothetical protein FE257_004616 [Aspergillus nanangensis]|uniref:ABC transporter domain-containing protein n=1 Tax=Aspergillus nanangensis TaxID=2582783 RepID=A0AAD4D0B0_ASPNN|nr:hypothetical protein FE257_004616 [Aspergillus nanangensis]